MNTQQLGLIDDTLFALFGYQEMYLGMTTSNLGILKIGVSRWTPLRWIFIDRSMEGSVEYWLFRTRIFFARPLEQHLHRVMHWWNHYVKGSGGTEWFWWIMPWTWPFWVYALGAILIATIFTWTIKISFFTLITYIKLYYG